jgi:hypothetical protein
MPAPETPESLAGAVTRITRAGGSWESPQLAAKGRALLVMSSLVSCTSAAFATYGVWQLASGVGELLDLARSVAPHVAVAETGEPALPPDPGPGGTSRSEASSTTAEASENPTAIGIPRWPEYVRTECKGVFVYIVTTSEHSPRDSAASLAASENGRARFRRAGQMLGDWEILGITDDWSGLNPAVWLVKGHEVCRAELAGNPSRVHVALKPPAKKRKPKRRRRGKRR